MKPLSPQSFLVVAAFTLGLVACAAAPPSLSDSRDFTQSGKRVDPTATTKEEASERFDFPPDTVDMKNPDKEIEKQKLEQSISKESDLGEAILEPTKDARERGTADPLAAPPLPPKPGASGTANPLVPLLPMQGATGPGGPPVQGDAFGSSGYASNARGGSHGTATGATGSTGSSGTNIGAATEVRGTIDKAAIQRVVRTHINDVRHCYDQGLARKPDLEGKVVLKFTIGKAGTVAAAKVEDTTLMDLQVEQCISGAAMRWSFPKPTGDGLVVISYPFILKSAN